MAKWYRWYRYPSIALLTKKNIGNTIRRCRYHRYLPVPGHHSLEAVLEIKREAMRRLAGEVLGDFAAGRISAAELEAFATGLAKIRDGTAWMYRSESVTRGELTMRDGSDRRGSGM